MSYTRVDFSKIDKVIEEYTNLYDVLETEKVAIATYINILIGEEWIGQDANFYLEQYNTVFVPFVESLQENIKNLIDELTDGEADFKEAKLYATDFIQAFEEAKSGYSLSDMEGRLVCDTDEIEKISNAILNQVNKYYPQLLERVNRAKGRIVSLNSDQSQIEDEMNSYTKDIEKMRKLGPYNFGLGSYSKQVEDADKALHNALSSNYQSLCEADKQEIKTDVEHNAQLDTLCNLLKLDYMTPEEKALYDKLVSDMVDNKEDITYVFGKLGESDKYSSNQAQFCADLYVSALNSGDVDLMNIVLSSVYTNDNFFCINTSKVEAICLYIDADENGEAYFGLQLFSNYSNTYHMDGVQIVKMEEAYYFEINEAQPENDDPERVSITYLEMIDMNERLTPEGRDNLVNNLGYSNKEVTDYLACIGSVDDIEFVLNLAEIEKSDTAGYEDFFSKNPSGLTAAVTPALADYAIHVADFDSGDGSDFTCFINAIFVGDNVGIAPYSGSTREVIGGITYYNMGDVGATYADVYLDMLNQGCTVRATVAGAIATYDLNEETFSDYLQKNTVLSTVSAVNYFSDKTTSPLLVDSDDRTIEISNVDFCNNLHASLTIGTNTFSNECSFQIDAYGNLDEGTKGVSDLKDKIATIEYQMQEIPKKTAYNIAKTLVSTAYKPAGDLWNKAESGINKVETGLDYAQKVSNGDWTVALDIDTKSDVVGNAQSIAKKCLGSYNSYNDLVAQKDKASVEFYKGYYGNEAGFVYKGNLDDKPENHCVVVSGNTVSPIGYQLTSGKMCPWDDQMDMYLNHNSSTMEDFDAEFETKLREALIVEFKDDHYAQIEIDKMTEWGMDWIHGEVDSSKFTGEYAGEYAAVVQNASSVANSITNIDYLIKIGDTKNHLVEAYDGDIY